MRGMEITRRYLRESHCVLEKFLVFLAIELGALGNIPRYPECYGQHGKDAALHALLVFAFIYFFF